MQHEPRRFPNPGYMPDKWPEETVVYVEFRNGTSGQYQLKQLRWEQWSWGQSAGDIVSFRRV